MARIRRKVRGRVLDADATELFADVAVLELEGGLLLVGRAVDYPDAPPYPSSSSLRLVAEVAAGRLRPDGRNSERYEDLDGNEFVVEKTTGRPFCCRSPYRSIGATVAV